MTTYRPPQRSIRAAILSLSRWIRGSFHVSRLHAFDDHLARVTTFFKLTDVELGNVAALPFLALRASAVQLVVPEVRERLLLLQPTLDTKRRDVSCYLESVAVRGTLELLPGVRTSDFLAHQEGFIALRRCRLVPPLPGSREPIPIIFVNARAIVAVAEEADGAGEPDDAETTADVPEPVS